ncbi:MAG: hypothetical protein REH79_00065 [Spiroplasma sp.]|nr:hypothetical protein [Spiroplasma sp.]
MKKLLSLLLSFTLVLTASTTFFILTVTENKNKNHDIDDLKSNIDQLEEKKQAIDIKIEDIKENIKKLQEGYELNKTKIVKLESELEKLKTQGQNIAKELYEKIKEFNDLEQRGKDLKTSLVVQYFLRWTKENPFDLNYEITINNTWADVLRKIKKEMVAHVYAATSDIFFVYDWRPETGRNINVKLKDDGVKTSEYFKVFVWKNFSFTMYFKNIKLI